MVSIARYRAVSLIGVTIVLVLIMTAGATSRAHAVDADPFREYRDEGYAGEYQYDDSQDIPWIENETEILALPSPDDLTRVEADDLPPGMQLLVDTRRISVGEKDRVVRLWLVVRSDGGVENGSYEGYRCDTREYKVYAHANPATDPPVRKARLPRWVAIKPRRAGNYRAELYEDFLCSFHGQRSAASIRDRMRGAFKRDSYFSY